jgi:formylglycine-generating enzyme required for sulfatase activity
LRSRSSETPAAVSGLKKETVDLGNGVKIDLVLIPPGSFNMGSKKSDSNDEKPVHKVTISRPFYIGAYEVTQAQWEAVMGSNPSNFKGPGNPVETVSWNDCQEFTKKLNEKIPGGGFRLPTEAEWEYVCRAGSTTEYCYGDEEGGLGEYAWYSSNSGSTTHPVGQKKPNAWGVYDMHGNVWELCQDSYHGSYTGAPSDGSAWEGPGGLFTTRVDRGGGWSGGARSCRSSARPRFSLGPDGALTTWGFRVARTP